MIEIITYHGSHIDFDKFQYNPRGIYFCDKANAINYAKVKYNRYKDYIGSYINKPVLYTCKITLENPVYISNIKYRDIEKTSHRLDTYLCDGFVGENIIDSNGIYNQYAVKRPEQIIILKKESLSL